MNSERQEALYLRLVRRLGLSDPEEEVQLLLWDVLEDARSEVLSYLGVRELEERFEPKVVELAALFFRRDRQELESAMLRSASYSEGQLSHSESYLTPNELHAGMQEILSTLARYRRVSC
jgi:hypothetical protein